MGRLLPLLFLLASSIARADDIGAMPEQTPCSRPLGCWQNGDIVGDAGGGVLNLGQRFIANCAPGMPCVVQIGQGTATSTDRVSLRLNSGAGNNNTGPSVIFSRAGVDLGQVAHDNANFYVDAGIGYYGTQGNWLFRPAINDNVCKSGTRQDRTCSTDDTNAITGCPGAGTCTGTGPPGGCCAANPVTLFITSYGQISAAYGGTSTITTAVPSALFPIIDIGTNNQFNFDNNNDAIAGLKFGNTSLAWISTVDDSGIAQGTVTVYDTSKIVSAPTDTARTMGLEYGFLFAPVRQLTSASANVALTVSRTRGIYFAPSYGRSAAVGTVTATEVTGFFDQPIGGTGVTFTTRRGYYWKDRGTGGTVTTSYGFDADDQTVGTTAAVIHSAMNSGTGKWTILADGTAVGSHKGAFRFGDNTAPTDIVEVLGAVHTFGASSAVKVDGATSGTTTVIATAVAGTGTLTLPTGTDTLVGKATTDDLSNKSIVTAGLAFKNATSGTVTLNTVTGALGSVTMSLPAATDTLVGKSTTDLFQNKTLRDDSVTFVDDGDTSKKLAFQISGITTATTRTWTVPDASSTLVGTDTTQTLTGKTYNTAGSGNVFQVNGQTISSQTADSSHHGVGVIVTSATATAQSANVSATNLIASATAGRYRGCCYTAITTAATTSSTLPKCQLKSTDPTDSVVKTADVNTVSTANTTGTASIGCGIIDAKSATAIQYDTTSYASSGATAMVYKVYITLEAL